MQQVLDLLHRHVEIACAVFRLGPVCRVDPRITVKRIDHHAGIIRKCWQPRCFSCRKRFDIGVFLKRGTGFIRLRQAKSGNRTDLKAERADQTVELLQLARIVRSDDQLALFQFSHFQFHSLGSAISNELPDGSRK